MWLRMLTASLSLLCLSQLVFAEDGPGQQSAPLRIPDAWQGRWREPSTADRPLQIIHGIQLEPNVAGDDRTAAVAARLASLQELGLGGIVCNMPFRNYMQSESDWATLRTAIEICRDRGLVVWLYDEQGYPSGAAGGMVLKENPEYQATELAIDTTQRDPFIVRPSYEFTHANNNFYASRRYVNLLDVDAVKCFVRTTHDAYWSRLEPFFGNTIQAMFTDEPSLLAISLGQIPESSRQRVPVIDVPDPDVKPLPAVPWCRDMLEQYAQRYGEDLSANRQSLFTGDTDDDRRVRRQFWALVSDLVAERYFGTLGRWCARHGVASSGHTLVEESILLQLAVEGNGLKALAQMQIPGLDALSSDPEAVIHIGWLTAGLPASAAAWNGGRRVMTEVSDFVQKLGGSGPASLIDMQATAAWQAAWGVTDFTLYYGPGDRTGDDYRAYCEFVGRLNAIVKPAERTAEVLLYYPMYDLWAEYRPVAERLTLESQSTRMQRIVASFQRLGQMLQRNQIPFVLIDHEHLARAEFDADGGMVIQGRRYRSILLPEGVELPREASNRLDKLRQQSATSVWQDGNDGSPPDVASIRRTAHLDLSIDPPSAHIVLGRFRRDGREVLLLVNVAREAYQGVLAGSQGKTWLELDPANGSTRQADADAQGAVSLRLAPRESRLLVELLAP